MTTKENLLNAISTFIEKDVLPKTAEGNMRIILRSAQAAIKLKPDAVFSAIKNNSAVAMLGAVDEAGNVDVDVLSKVLTEGFGSDEYTHTFRLFGKEYTLHLSSADIQTIIKYT